MRRDFFDKRRPQLLLLGLDGAGKSHIRCNACHSDVDVIIHSIGYNVGHFDFAGARIVSWDCGSATKMRLMWENYLRVAHGIIWLVDSSERYRLEEDIDLLHWITRHRALIGLPLLVCANKQDLPQALSPTELAVKLQLDKIADRPLKIVGTCALTGDGFMDGFVWLANQVGKHI